MELEVVDSTGAFKLGRGLPVGDSSAYFNITDVSGTLVPYSGYYWTAEWQQGEDEVGEAIANGGAVEFGDAEAALDYLRNL